MKSYRDLIVWQKSMSLVIDIYKITEHFPEAEKFGLTSQLKRCAISIPSNIAEGYGRNYTKDFILFLQIARGSLFECKTQLEIVVSLAFINVVVIKDASEKAFEVEKMLNSLINKLNPR